jgi:hypothetical protein
MMDLTASGHDLRCERIRDLIVAQQSAAVRRVIEIPRAEHSARTGVTPGSAKPRRSRSDRHDTVSADIDGFGSHLLKLGTSTARFKSPAPTCTTANRIAVHGAR